MGQTLTNICAREQISTAQIEYCKTDLKTCTGKLRLKWNSSSDVSQHANDAVSFDSFQDSIPVYRLPTIVINVPSFLDVRDVLYIGH